MNRFEAALASSLVLLLVSCASDGPEQPGPDMGGPALEDGAGGELDAGVPLPDSRPSLEGAPEPDSAGPSGCVHPGVVKICADGWCQIPKGCFLMGSPSTEPCREPGEAQREVTLRHDFEIQATEVTQQQFEGLMGYQPSYGASCGSDCPVEMVSWHEAAAYANALSAKAGLAACYSCTGEDSITCAESSAFGGEKIYRCSGYRLPTEAEWEYAYRAGTATAFHNGPMVTTECHGSDATADQIAWYSRNSSGAPHPVGQKAENGWGLKDMGGNVWEWCHDWWGPSAAAPVPATDPHGASAGSDRVVRGGFYGGAVKYVRAANRGKNDPTLNIAFGGFRLVRTR